MSISQIDLQEGILPVYESLQQTEKNALSPDLQALRQRSIEAWKASDYPTTKHEEWKYTNLKKLIKNTFAFQPEAKVSRTVLNEHLFEGFEGDVMVFANGAYQPALSRLTPTKGLTVGDMSTALQEQAALFEPLFGKYAQVEGQPFTALNTALANHGGFIHAAKNTVVEQPILLLHFLDANAANIMVHPRNLVVAEENTQLTLIEHFVHLGEQESFINAVNEVHVAKNAHVKHYKLQNNEPHYHVSTTEVQQADNSQYHNTTVSLKGKLVRNNLNITLDGEYCETFMNGLYMLEGKAHVDNHTMVDHLKPNAYSNELYKGIMDGHSTGVFNGKIYVRQLAQKTNAFQSNKNILLSNNASVDTKPQLEIWADDVKCSHGATTGALDEEPLFYLRSRGISEGKAKALLMHAFASDVLARVTNEPFKGYVEQLISERLD